MDIIGQFKSIIEALLSDNNELIQQAQSEYIEMMNTSPEQLVFVHFQIIISTEKQQIKDSALVLLGNFFSLIKQSKKNLSPEACQEIKSLLLQLFKNEDFTEYHFGIISNIVFKSKQYFENDWPELIEELSNLLNHTNPIISSTAASCLSDCIKYHLVDHEQYIDAYLSYIFNLLTNPPETIPKQITSILRFFYSITSTIIYIQNLAKLIPIANLIPNFITISHDNPTIINDFYYFASTHMQLFIESYQALFQTMTDMISSEDFSSGIKNTAILIIIKLVPHYLANFQPHANDIFDFFASQLPQEEIQDFCVLFLSQFSKLYGSNPDYAIHVYTFFQNNVPDPFSYVAIGTSYEGIKEHFSHCEFSKEILELFSQGFTSQEDFTRLKSFQYFVPLIDIFYQYDDDINPSETMEALLSIISTENNADVLFEEIKMLSGLLSHYALIFGQEIDYIVKLLDQLIDICTQSEYIITILFCYKSVAKAYKEKFLPNSQQCVLKMSQYISNPQDETEDIFFYCMEIMPSFKLSIPQEAFEELMSNLFEFLFSIVYDEDGNENEEYSLSSSGQCSILKFFLSCLFNETLNDSPEIIEKIIPIAFKVASTEIKFETVSTDSDISMYDKCMIITVSQENKFIIVGEDEIIKIQNTLIILYQIFSLNDQVIVPFVDNLIEITIKLLNQKFFRDILNNIYSLETLFVPFIDNKQILTLLMCHAKNSLNPDCDMYNFNCFAKLFTIFIKTAGEKYKSDEFLIQCLLKFSFHFLEIIFVESEKDEQKAVATKNIIYMGNESDRIQVNYALSLRELFRYFPIYSSSFFPNIYDLVNNFQKKKETKKTLASIIFSDFIRFCPQENPELFTAIVEFFKQGIESDFIGIKLDAIFGLSSIISPKYINPDEMKVFVEMFINCNQGDNNDEIKSMIAFALLQIFQNYAADFDVSVFFTQFLSCFQTEVYQIPKYCREYYAQSLIFFVSNFKDSIPEDQIEKFQMVFQKLLIEKLDPTLIEALEAALTSILQVE